ncbi:hypothetical protein V2J09_014332 [Rumex salicifolius]
MAKVVIAVCSLLMVAACIGAAVSMSGKGKHKESGVNTSNRSIQSLCAPTSYKDECVNSLNAAAPNTTDPTQLIKVSFQLTRKSLTNAIGRSNTVQQAMIDPRAAQALEICRQVMNVAADNLERSVMSIGNIEKSADMNQFLQDLKLWLGSVITFQDVCFDSFANCTDTEPGRKFRTFFNTSRQLTSNALTLMDEAKDLVSLLNVAGGNPTRRLLGNEPAPMAGDLPAWLKDPQRKILDAPDASVNATIVVALDGSGQFKTISEALASNPNKTDKPFIIRIKEGIYRENVTVGLNQDNVVFIGDGPTKTIITGSKSFADGFPVYNTATVAIMGNGFIAKNIGFENTAGAERHQAVALRVVGDYAVFLNCQFDGFESTLNPVRGRHFYRDCTVKGTIDMIFGDAEAIFQNCRMVIKKPMEDQDCTVVSQGRSEAAGPGAIILQNCTIVADPQFTENAKAGRNKAYLGRPGKMYSRAIIMQTDIDASIDPAGWKEWAGSLGIDTSFLAEYKNRGPGSNTGKRVTWKAIKKLNVDQVQEFTPDAFYKGGSWISPTGAPYTGALMPGL